MSTVAAPFTLSLADFQDVRARIAPHIKHTPLLSTRQLSEHTGYEVRVNGQAINPLTARLVSRPVFDGAQLAAFKARLKQVTSIPMTLKSAPKVPVAG